LYFGRTNVNVSTPAILTYFTTCLTNKAFHTLIIPPQGPLRILQPIYVFKNGHRTTLLSCPFAEWDETEDFITTPDAETQLELYKPCGTSEWRTSKLVYYIKDQLHMLLITDATIKFRKRGLKNLPAWLKPGLSGIYPVIDNGAK